jgi:hypothetical protein
MCVLDDYLQHWEQAIEWCEKSRVGWPDNWSTHVHLAAAHAWAGHDKEAKDIAVQLQKVHPGFTVQTYADLASHKSDNPTFTAQYISASSKASARRACRRATRRGIDRAAGAMLVAGRLAGLFAL